MRKIEILAESFFEVDEDCDSQEGERGDFILEIAQKKELEGF